MLTTQQRQRYEQDGFLVMPGFASADACRALRARAMEIVADFQPSEHRTVFTTNEQERASNREFLASGAGIWCFFEEGAFDAEGRLTREVATSINKIGHAQHDLDPVFEAFTYTPELAAVAADIGLIDAVALQSMYIFKQPLIGGEVGCHQDATFLYTEPLSVTGFWFAIEDATIDNGCLWAVPGGHRTSLRRLMQRVDPADDDAGTRFEVLDERPLPAPGDELVPLEVETGTMIVLHGLLPHRSEINTSPVSRHAYSVHCISGRADYPDWNWLQRPASMPLRSLADVAATLSSAPA